MANRAKRIIKELISDVCYWMKSGFSPADPDAPEGCRILLYHNIDEKITGCDYLGLTVQRETFEFHMRYLVENGYRVIDLRELIAVKNRNERIPDRAVIITFDDGYKGVKKYAEPILVKYGLRATVFVTTGYIDGNIKRGDYWTRWDFMGWDDIKTLKNMDAGSHSVSHRRLDLLSKREIEIEVKKSMDVISRNTGKKIDLFSYPHGGVNDEALSAVKACGYIGACSSVKGVNGRDMDLYRLKRTEIDSFDSTEYRFKKKLLSCYD